MGFEELIAELGAHGSIEEKVKVYFANVGCLQKLTTEGALQSLIGYFGEPTPQEEDFAIFGSEDYFGSPVLPELGVLQRTLVNSRFDGSWNIFGKDRVVIEQGQLAFLRREGPIVRAAVYRPFNEGAEDEASIQLFEYDSAVVK